MIFRILFYDEYSPLYYCIGYRLLYYCICSHKKALYIFLSVNLYLFGRATIRLCALLVGLLRVELCIAVFNYLVVFREGYHGLLTRCSNHRRIREQGADGPWEPEATESPSTGRSPQAGSGRTSASSRSRNPIAPRSKAYSPKFA